MQTLRAVVDGRRLSTIVKLPEAFRSGKLEIDVYLNDEASAKPKSDGESPASANKAPIKEGINLNSDNDLAIKRYSLKERLAMLDSLIGIVPSDVDAKRIKDERLARQ